MDIGVQNLGENSHTQDDKEGEFMAATPGVSALMPHGAVLHIDPALR